MQTDEILAVNIAEAARRLGLSARTVATLVLRRELPSRKVGRRRIIPVVALEAFVRTDHSRGIVRVKTTETTGESGSTG
jgi:excisionase family DNA binding protein